ncbi:COX8 domain-containing protein [Pangasianodon hypophthalmus]|uniref:COX8 domain-containing protein n=1 Tax=Pangasianodon hypophthalmus TaxID=310915 RepID=UPI000EFDD961|nr:COX8 domain-containing protein [Pangasianodon hypophthalmus]
MLVALSRTSRAVQLRTLSWSRAVLQNRSGSIYSKPPKTKIGPGQSFFIMSVFAAALLLPAGWILHHLPEYRHRRPAPPS